MRYCCRRGVGCAIGSIRIAPVWRSTADSPTRRRCWKTVAATPVFCSGLPAYIYGRMAVLA